MNLKQSDQRISRQDYDWLVAWTHFSQCWGSSWTISRLSLRSPVKPSLWRRWTGRRCPSSRRLRSLVCGCAAFLLRTDVSAGGGESKTESWSSENETCFIFSLVVFLHTDWPWATWTWRCVLVSVDVVLLLWLILRDESARGWKCKIIVVILTLTLYLWGSSVCTSSAVYY